MCCAVFAVAGSEQPSRIVKEPKQHAEGRRGAAALAACISHQRNPRDGRIEIVYSGPRARQGGHRF